jgi:hypothetical protein
VLAEARAVFVVGSLMSRRIECGRSMHDWIDVASDAFAGIFRGAAEIVASGSSFQTTNESKDCQMKRAQIDHDVRASNEGCGP